MSSTSNLSFLPAELCRNWLELPPDLMASIFQNVGVIDILKSAQKVCTAWRSICKDPAMWRTIDMLNLGIRKVDCDFEKLCMHLVDRSKGQLLDISIGCFSTDKLLHYISDRSIQLRRLQLVCCCQISTEGFCEFLKKLPFLEELELQIPHTYISKECIVVTGRFCPLLKSFKLNREAFRRPQIECDEEALAIAENMHELTHLQLFGNKMTNLGLQAILDNCYRLESRDLRMCFNIVLEGDLEEKCWRQIRVLRYPNEFIEEFGFYVEIEDEDWDWDSSYEDYPCGFSDVDLSDDGDYYEFSDNDEYENYF